MTNFSKNKKGFTLLMTVLVSTIVISVGLGIFDIIYRELILSNVGRDSQEAFYVADSALECLVYYDLKQNIFNSNEPDPKINCGGEDIFLLEKEEVGPVGPWAKRGIDVLDSCADVSISSVASTRPGYSDIYLTSVKSTGYSNCTDNSRKIERAIELIY